MSQNGQIHFKYLAAALSIPPENNRKPFNFLKLSGGIEMGYKIFKTCLTILGHHTLKD